MTCGIPCVSAKHIEIIECFAVSGGRPNLPFRLTHWKLTVFPCFARFREVRVSPRVSAKHIEIIECFAVRVFRRNTPSVSSLETNSVSVFQMCLPYRGAAA